MGFFTFISFSKSVPIFLLAFFIANSGSSQHLPSFQRPQCIHEHFSALLQLKAGFQYSHHEGKDFYQSNTNLSSWSPENRDCCSWEGITCDRSNGHVTRLHLSELHIYGKINLESLCRIQSLRILNLAYNKFDKTPFPSAIGNLTSLTHLNLSHIMFYGQVPLEMSSLTRLVSLDLSRNGYYDDDDRLIPLELESIGALIQNMSTLRELNLGYVDMSAEGNQWSQVISSALPNLRMLRMYNCSLSGTIHLSWLTNLTKLEYLQLSNNSLNGIIPSSLFTLPSLRTLKLGDNQLHGQLSQLHNSSSSLIKLEYLSLSVNNLNGTIPSLLFTLPSLRTLRLWGNQLGGQLSEFHNSSSSLLETIDLSYNELEGKIPRSIFQLRELNILVLNANNFSGVLDLHIFDNLTNLFYLDLSVNALKGSLPILSTSMTAFLISTNHLNGEIPMSICNASSLDTFDIHNNNFSGHIPCCFGEMSNALTNLNLGRNSLSGPFFQTFKENCSLERLVLSENQLEGKLPASLANCKNLAILDLGNNRIHDTFPSWVYGLAYLRIFTLTSNNFYGLIQPPPTCQNFSNLLIVDLSFNNFNGSLPPAMFCGWKKMTGEDSSEPKYLKTSIEGYAYYYESAKIRSKRLEMKLAKISTAHTVVDLSRNHFEGQIPESIGNLKSLWILNMSHNGFTGHIPLSFKNLTALESLDLSQNNLSGNIPQELLELTFLEVLDLSKNQLIGNIPHAKQFSTFTNESFEGNPGLCGPPLSKVCGDTNGAPSSSSNDTELFSESEYSWKIIAIGFGIGYGVGVGAFCWTLVLWTRGRRAFNKFVHGILLLILPSTV